MADRNTGRHTRDDALVHTQVAITPSDATVLSPCIVYVGTGGDVNCVMDGDSTAVILKNVPSGSYIPGKVIMVYSTSTTASNMVAWR